MQYNMHGLAVILLAFLSYSVDAQGFRGNFNNNGNGNGNRQWSSWTETQVVELICRRRPHDQRCGGGGGGGGVTDAPNTRPPLPAGLPQPKSPDLPSIRAKVQSVCAQRDCHSQSAASLQSKAATVNDLLAGGGGIDRAQAQAVVDAGFRAKQALLARDGLEGVVTARDDGMYKGSLISARQADQLVAHSRRAKRYAWYMEGDLASKWDMPIPYAFHADLSYTRKEVIRAAIREIESKSCIQFEEQSSKPAGQHMFFQATNSPAICGLSFIGRVEPYNHILLNFANGCETILEGTILHEILHSLGMEHTQSRYDRDDYIDVHYDNIDPQIYDWFAYLTEDQTSYGLPYDYLSVMHYGPQTGTLDTSRTSMDVLKDPWFFQSRLGQRKGLSDRDGEMLRKLYCLPNCKDDYKWCGWWATAGYCTSALSSVAPYCPKSCNLCFDP